MPRDRKTEVDAPRAAPKRDLDAKGDGSPGADTSGPSAKRRKTREADDRRAQWNDVPAPHPTLAGVPARAPADGLAQRENWAGIREVMRRDVAALCREWPPERDWDEDDGVDNCPASMRRLADAMVRMAIGSGAPGRCLAWQLREFWGLLGNSPRRDDWPVSECFRHLAAAVGYGLHARDRHQVAICREDPRAIGWVAQFASALLATRPAGTDAQLTEALHVYVDESMDGMVHEQERHEEFQLEAARVPKDEQRYPAVRHQLENLMDIVQPVVSAGLVPPDRWAHAVDTAANVYWMPDRDTDKLVKSLFQRPDCRMPVSLACYLAYRVAGWATYNEIVVHFHLKRQDWGLALLRELLTCPQASPADLDGFLSSLLDRREPYRVNSRSNDPCAAVCDLAESFEPGLRGRLRALLMDLPRDLVPDGPLADRPAERPWDALVTQGDVDDPVCLRRHVMAFYWTRHQMAAAAGAQGLEVGSPLPPALLGSLGDDELLRLRRAACEPFERLQACLDKDGKEWESGAGLDASDLREQQWGLFLEAMRLPGALVPATRQKLRELVLSQTRLDAQQRGEAAEVLLSCPQATLEAGDLSRFHGVLLEAAEHCAQRSGAAGPSSKDEKAVRTPASSGPAKAGPAGADISPFLGALQSLSLRVLSTAGLRLSPDSFDAIATPATRLQDVEAALDQLEAEQETLAAQRMSLNGRDDVRAALLRHASSNVDAVQRILKRARDAIAQAE